MKKLLLISLALVTLVACKNKKKDTELAHKTTEVLDTTMSESNWTTLFDGTSYENWRGYLLDSMPSNWSIEDGAMAFTPSKEGGKNIISKGKYTNFVLSLEWKISEGGNSGIFWGVHEDAKFKEAYETGPEIQVLDNEARPEVLTDEKDIKHQAGSLYDMIAPSANVAKPTGEWNVCIIEVDHKNNQGKVSLNGTEIVTFPVNGAGWDTMVENSKFKGWEGFGKYQIGHIGLQDHGNKVWYRNIKIKEL